MMRAGPICKGREVLAEVRAIAEGKEGEIQGVRGT